MSSSWKWIFAIVLSVGFYHFYFADSPLPPPGITAPDDPQIILLGDPPPWTAAVGDYTITPIAQFSMQARVLHTQTYWMDREADLAPVDFAVGWGQMSDQTLLDQIDIEQSDRFYYWHYDKAIPVSNSYIISHSGNMHMVPANDDIRKELKSVRKNDIINVTGYLIKVTAPDGYHWNSALSLNATGPHACKLIWVQSLTVVPP